MSDIPPISEAESLVMEVLWRTSPIATEDVVAALSTRQDWQEPTIKTLLSRLLKKGAISAEREGGVICTLPFCSGSSGYRSKAKGFWIGYLAGALRHSSRISASNAS